MQDTETLILHTNLIFIRGTSMGFTETLTMTICFITALGTILGGYVTYKIYSSKGFR